MATAAAALTGFLIPWEVAFLPPEELYSFGSPWAALNLVLVALFGADMVLSSRLAYWEGEVLVDGPREMAQHYMKDEFCADLLGFVPADWLLLGALAACGAVGGGGGAGGACAGVLEWLPLLRLLHLARLYRVKQLFSYLVRTVFVVIPLCICYQSVVGWTVHDPAGGGNQPRRQLLQRAQLLRCRCSVLPPCIPADASSSLLATHAPSLLCAGAQPECVAAASHHHP